MSCPVTLILAMALVAPSSVAQLTDPLGSPLFFGRGTPIYDFDASYAILGGDSTVLRDKRFREKTKGLNYFTFDINRPNIRHQLTVGNFQTKFSSFGLNKELFDAVRWTITVPRARGSATGFLGRLTNNTFAPSGNPIEGQEIQSSGDWFMAGLRAEANLGSWNIQLGERQELTIPLPQIGVNFTNRFFTNYDLARTTNPFRGVTIAAPPGDLFVRFRDDSPEDGGGGKIYRMRVLIDGETRFDFAGGREPPGVLVQETNTSRVSMGDGARIADGPTSFTYRFPLFNAQEIETVEFVIDAANDYLIELLTPAEFPATEAQFQRRAQARGNVKDESNRRIERFFFGDLTDESTFGFDAQTTISGFSIEAERTWHSRTLQYPLFNAERRRSTAGAWFVDMNRSVGPLFWRGEYTRIDPFYTATNFVDDNDNDDPYLDAREPSAPFAGSDRDDRDRDGIKDWEDDFLLFYADDPRFVLGLSRESIDFNNNGQPDNLEDDRNPNYRLDYDEGSNGFHSYVIFDAPITEGLQLIPGYYEKNSLADGKNAQGRYGILSYEPKRITGFGRARARYTVRRAKDSIPDDTIQGGRVVEDDLRLSDYLGNIFTLIVDYDNVENLTITTKFKYERNSLFNFDERIVDAQLIHQVRYNYQVRDDLTLSPAFRSDRTISYTIPFRASGEENSLRNAYILTLSHHVADELQLSAGLQYLTWRDFVEPRNDFNRRVGFLQLVLQGEAFGQQIGLISTIDFVTQTFLQPIGGDERLTNISVGLFLL